MNTYKQKFLGNYATHYQIDCDHANAQLLELIYSIDMFQNGWLKMWRL